MARTAQSCSLRTCAHNYSEADTIVQAKYVSGRAYDLMSKANADYALANATHQPLPRFMKAYAQQAVEQRCCSMPEFHSHSKRVPRE